MSQTSIVPISTGMGPITDGFLDEISNRISSAEFSQVAQKMCAPIRDAAIQMIRPYLWVAFLIQMLIIALLLVVIWNTCRLHKSVAMWAGPVKATL